MSRRVVIAAEVLRAGGVDLDSLRLVLPRVDPGRVRIRVAPFWYRAVWGRRIAAVAMFWGIYVRPEVMARLVDGTEPERNASLIVHELAHIEQWKRLGPLRHSIRYLGDYLRGRVAGRGHWEAYREIRLEVEARQTARLVRAMRGTP